MGFLDNLKGSLSQTADRAKYEMDKMQQTGRLRNEVSDLQQQVDTNFRQLGMRAYELHRQAQISAPELGSLVQIISDLQSQLTIKQQELDQVQSEQFEATQGQPHQQAAPPQSYGPPPQEQQWQSAPPANDVLTGATGYATPVPTPPQPVDAGMYACPSCGTKLDADSVFCPNCGAKVSA